MRNFLVLVAFGVLSNALEVQDGMAFQFSGIDPFETNSTDHSYKNALYSYEAFVQSQEQEESNATLGFLKKKPLTLSYLNSPLHEDKFRAWRIAVATPKSKR